jgi:hypothetical protein
MQQSIPPPINQNQQYHLSLFAMKLLRMLTMVIFVRQHQSKSAPIAMTAFAFVVNEKIVLSRTERMADYFYGLTIVVPPTGDEVNSPEYHSIERQRLLWVDWKRTFNLDIKCPDTRCCGTLQSRRHKFSKNQTLFPIFGLDGPPAWCVIMILQCNKCKRTFDSNQSEVLCQLPEYAANAYPVEHKYALADHSCRINTTATQVFESLMVTYGNGELCSRLTYNSINRDYLQRLKCYLIAPKKGAKSLYVLKDGGFISQYPPTGETIREMYDKACASPWNPWRVSNYMRHTREIQSVQCKDGVFAQDHTFEVVKNYQKTLGGKAVWDVATETGEIAPAVVVPSTKTQDFAHAAIQLSQRPHFSPKALYSDTWPNKSEFGENVYPSIEDRPAIEGRLGLFHFEKRIISTLMKKHVDYNDALTDLLKCLYAYHSDDYDKLIQALKNGTLSTRGKKYIASEIEAMEGLRRSETGTIGTYASVSTLPTL